MQELKGQLINQGFLNPRTLLASGNILVEGQDNDKRILEQKMCRFLEETYHYEAHVIIKSKDEVEAICKQARMHLVNDSMTHYILLLQNKEDAQEIKELFDVSEHTYQEMLIVHETGCYWMVEKGHTLDTAFGKIILGNKKYRARITSRNINTLYKVEAKMQGVL